MKILVVHEVDYLEKVIYEIHEFSELLALAGHEVTFFHFQEEARRSSDNLFRDVNISGRVYPDAKFRLIGPHQFGIPILDRLWVTLSCIPMLFKLFKNNRFDMVLNFAVPTYGAQLLLISKFFKVPFIHRALDVSHKIRQTIYKYPILLVEKILYKYADLVSANNLAMKEYCEELSNRTKTSIVHYPPLDLVHFVKKEKNQQLMTAIGIDQNHKVIMYMGSFFYFSGLLEILKIFNDLSINTSQIKLLLIGGGEQDKALRKLVKDLNLTSKVIFTGYIAYQDLPQYLHLADVAINPLESNLVTNTALPNKVLQYLASDLPVVSINLKGLKSIFNNNPAITWCDTPEEVIQQAFKLVIESNLAQLSESSKSELKSILKQFEPEIALRSLEQSIKQLARMN
jgi:glycosyltransferase involved in cell wall biosynthesis